MGDTSIRISEEAKERLELAKREGESYDDVIMRLARTDKWLGFGALADAEQDTREGMEEVRREMRERTEHDLDGMASEGSE